MIIWFFTIFLFFKGLKLLFEEFKIQGPVFSLGKERWKIQHVISALLEFEETLESGLIPDQDKWATLQTLTAPWGSLAYESVRDLRSRGAPLLPTLKRLRSLAQSHSESLNDARAKSAQALGQAMACGFLVPLFGAVLFVLLPGLSERPYFWSFACLIALILSGFGAAWVLFLAQNARWGGLKVSQRPWTLSAQCAGERFLALVRSGQPPDLAWTETCKIMSVDSPELALAWGYSVFESPVSSSFVWNQSSLAKTLVQTGTSIRKSIHISLMEGRPSIERVESALIALRQEIKSLVDRELALLGNRALKPLFLCVAPSLLGLLAVGMWVTWNSLGVNL